MNPPIVISALATARVRISRANNLRVMQSFDKSGARSQFDPRYPQHSRELNLLGLYTVYDFKGFFEPLVGNDRHTRRQGKIFHDSPPSPSLPRATENKRERPMPPKPPTEKFAGQPVARALFARIRTIPVRDRCRRRFLPPLAPRRSPLLQDRHRVRCESKY